MASRYQNPLDVYDCECLCPVQCLMKLPFLTRVLSFCRDRGHCVAERPLRERLEGQNPHPRAADLRCVL